MAHGSWGGPGVPAGGTLRITHPRMAGLALNVRREVVPLFQRLVDELATQPKYWRDGKPRLSSSGGYVKRLMRGSKTKWSNHSWGLAVDFNAATNPMQRRLRTDFVPAEVSALAASLGMSWGGNWPGRKDPMHFEFIGSRDDAARRVRNLTNTQPATTATSSILKHGSTGPEVTALQTGLNRTFPAYSRLAIDGDYGPTTTAAVREFQRRSGLVADGQVGPATAAKLAAFGINLTPPTTTQKFGTGSPPGQAAQ